MLQIKDRIKDVIKTGGEWISTIELENLISLATAYETTEELALRLLAGEVLALHLSP